MSKYDIPLITTEGTFRGLAKQNILFHQCIGELVDNSISSAIDGGKFKVDIILNQSDNPEVIDVYIADNGRGMNLETLSKALQLGESATTSNRLNEHGFGLKNSLATLSNGNGFWEMWTKAKDEPTVYYVRGPFKPSMEIDDEGEFPRHDFLPSDFSTLIHVPVKKSFVQTVQGRGARTNDLTNIRQYLIEHLGVLYRGYLEQDKITYDNSGVIVVHVGRNSQRVPPVPVPLGKMEINHLDVEIDGQIYKLEYRHGALDEVQRESLIAGQKSRLYYQGNIPTQGIDIRLGKRTIATSQLQTIWKNEKGDSQLNRHNDYNDFLGELIIPDLPRGVLTTVNNKTDFNLDDPNWSHIFEALNQIRPPKHVRAKSEKEIRERWVGMLRATNKDDEVTEERYVWPTGTRIDVYRKKPDGQIIIYELKVGSGAPEHLYQLKMYWDGLVISNKESPHEAILFCNDFDAKLQEMANMMNEMPTPNGSKPYSFSIEKLKDKGLS